MSEYLDSGCESCTGVPVTFVTTPDGSRQRMTLGEVLDANRATIDHDQDIYASFINGANRFDAKVKISTIDNGDGTFAHTFSFE